MKNLVKALCSFTVSKEFSNRSYNELSPYVNVIKNSISETYELTIIVQICKLETSKILDLIL